MENTNTTTVNAANGLIGRFPQLAAVSTNLLAKVGEIDSYYKDLGGYYSRGNTTPTYIKRTVVDVKVEGSTVAVLAEQGHQPGPGGMNYTRVVFFLTERETQELEFRYRHYNDAKMDDWKNQFVKIIDLLPESRVVVVERGEEAGPMEVQF